MRPREWEKEGKERGTREGGERERERERERGERERDRIGVIVKSAKE